jgi:hypothetical protein
MLAYLFIPHLYYYLISAGDARYEDSDEIIEETK